MLKLFDYFFKYTITITNRSKSVAMVFKASSGVFTGGSPLILNDVLTITGQPVFF